MTSSTVTYVGHISQANYAAANAVLDNLARQRVRLGLPVATVSLGPIKGVGTLNRKPEYSENLLRSGLIEAEDGGTAGDAAADVNADDRDRAMIVLAEAVAQRLAKLLFIPLEDIDISRPFSHFGLDSMSGSELIHWLSQRFGLGMSFLQLLAPSCTPKSLGGSIFDTIAKAKVVAAEVAATVVTIPEKEGRTHAAMRRAIADPQPVMHSYVCTVINRNGEQLYSLTEGTMSKDGGTPADFDGVYGMASLSKLMTTVAIMQCVERGQISLDDDVAPILPDLCSLPVLDGVDAEGQCRTKPRTKPITMRLLMSHQSGCGYHESPGLPRWGRQNGQTSSTFDSDFEAMKTYPLIFEPGEGWMYGSGFDWAGEYIARINHTTLEELMRVNIWEPLGMDSTTFHPERHPGMMDRIVPMYERTNDQGLAPRGPLSHIPARHDCGGHGIWSTPRDWTRFLGMVLADGAPLLSPASMDEIFRPQTADVPELQALLSGPLRASLLSTVAMEAGAIEIAFGGPLYMDAVPGRRSAGSLQWAGRPNMFWWIDRAKGVAATTFTQVISPADTRFAALTSALERAVYAELV
ncbi:beta-lactamase/transpeptidase-like protein [Aspergillus heteromorphus CBS 117.55]|uniref:Beta-lactamase/transpeptidase-like protein n=1 Tax=Aspergillus heteromorphus CBS 117.55 TaxID=1448321 RepID=A0A317VMC7_9EURO|nr:beta-lactamase/transpeptidase-like protein [Aspergillus heteromorphus CBS 117.55]PWY75523.1 beta-lactamase/transpeptidase-like protein [Aspergillus heteromorphus CBS 117.55]